jgi:hypothetical protein
MTEQITDADLQTLLRENPLAAEQLRRIMAERHREELQAELADLRAQANGVGTEAEAVVEGA